MITIQIASANDTTRDDKGVVGWKDLLEDDTHEELLMSFIAMINDEEVSVENNFFRIIEDGVVQNL